MRKVKWIPMPAGQIMSMVSSIARSNPYLQRPVTLEDMLRAKDRYIHIASLLN